MGIGRVQGGGRRRLGWKKGERTCSERNANGECSQCRLAGPVERGDGGEKERGQVAHEQRGGTRKTTTSKRGGKLARRIYGGKKSR